jgi:hypothetical protein
MVTHDLYTHMTVVLCIAAVVSWLRANCMFTYLTLSWKTSSEIITSLIPKALCGEYFWWFENSFSSMIFPKYINVRSLLCQMLKYETPLSFSRVNTVNMHYLLLRSKYYPVLKYLYIAYLLCDIWFHTCTEQHTMFWCIWLFLCLYIGDVKTKGSKPNGNQQFLNLIDF